MFAVQGKLVLQERLNISSTVPDGGDKTQEELGSGGSALVICEVVVEEDSVGATLSIGKVYMAKPGSVLP